MLERAKGIVGKVTLEVIYDAVEERTAELYRKIEEVEKQGREDFRYLNQRIDSLRQEVKEEVKQLRQEINQIRQEINQIRQEISQVNHRIDTVIQMLSEIMRR